MKRKIYKWNIISITLIGVIFLISLVLSYLYIQKGNIKVDSNQIRLMTREQTKAIEQGVFEPGEYAYIVYDLEGKVLAVQPPFPQKIGDQIHVQEMQQNDKSSEKQYPGFRKEAFVITKDGKVSSFITYLLPDTFYETESSLAWALQCLLPVIVGGLLIAIIAIIRVRYINHRILEPIGEISTSAKAIIAGNYDVEVVRVYGEQLRKDEVGELTYSFELMRDELKAKQIREEELKASQQELISCISHDLRTPISTIKAYSEGIRDGIAKTDEAKKEYMKVILEKTNLLSNMIADLLEVSNAELNQMDFVFKEVYFKKFYHNLMKELSGYIKHQKIEFTYTEVSDDMIISMDEKRITEVVYNLVENSMKYMRDGQGMIGIAAERQGNYMAITISDNGMGITQSDIPYIFSKFYRAEKSRSSRIPGSGLGLSICKYIVETHGGEISCKSKGKDQGAEFTFTLKAL